MVMLKEIECMCSIGDNKIIHAPKRQSMKKSKMRCVYKRNSIMFFFSRGKGESIKTCIKNIKGQSELMQQVSIRKSK